MMLRAKSWLKTSALACAVAATSGSATHAEIIHAWEFEESIGSSPVDSDDALDGYVQNVNLYGATQVSNAGTGAPIGLGSQALKTGDGNAAAAGGQKAGIWSTTGVPNLGYKGLSAGAASMWVYRTADQVAGNNSNTIFTVERDGSTGGGGRISVQVVAPNSAGNAPSGRVVGGITVSGREGPGNSTRMTYSTQAAQGNLVPLNTWTHIVAIWDYENGDPDNDGNPDPDNDGLLGGTMLLYVNGSPVLGGTYANPWPDDGGSDTNLLTSNDANGIVFGSGNADPAVATPNQEEFEGLIDGFLLFNEGLTGDEVSALYRSYLVPEPASLLLMSCGLLFVGRRRRAG